VKQTTAYEVEVQTTNGANDTFCAKGEYLACEDGKIVVVTDLPGDIFSQWGEKVLSVRRMCHAIVLAPVGGKEEK
jgi:hypothetical protein